jgi:molybdopterin converting factor subunit 1
MKVLFFAQLREAAGIASAEIDASGVDASSLWSILLDRWPALASYRANTRLARNGAYAGHAEIFGAGDEVALIPPVSGG